MELRRLRRRDLRHGFLMAHQPALGHVLQRPVRLDLPQERVHFPLQIRDLGHRGQGHGALISLSHGLVQQTDALQPVIDGVLQGQPIEHKGVDLPLLHRAVRRHFIFKVFDLRLGQLLSHQPVLCGIRGHADLPPLLIQLRQGGHGLPVLPGASRRQAKQHRQQHRRPPFKSRLPFHPFPSVLNDPALKAPPQRKIILPTSARPPVQAVRRYAALCEGSASASTGPFLRIRRTADRGIAPPPQAVFCLTGPVSFPGGYP